MRPHLLLTEADIDNLRSLADIRASLNNGLTKDIWRQILDRSEEDFKTEPYTPKSFIPNRTDEQQETGNRDYHIVAAACERIKRSALVSLLTGERRFADEAIRQMECVYDETQWPDWRDLAHQWHPSDLRTGQFMRAIGFAYDWLYPILSDVERRWITEGLDRRGIQPYLETLKQGAFWAISEEPNNWMTCIVGGAGIAGMAFGDDHPQSQQLVDFAVGKFKQYLDVLGPEGESNESIGYAGAMHLPIQFFNVHGYHQPGESQLLDDRVTNFCDWYMYFFVPPGVNTPFGDSHLDAPPSSSMFATMAATTREPIYQWFYEQHRAHNIHADLCEELLSYDPSVPSESPEGRIPLGRGFRGHSACWSSRTNWDQHSTPCVVYGKGGHGSEGHGNHDAGSVCIEAHARRLITDPGILQYPKDFFGENRYRYYNAAASGHNVPVFGRREMRMGVENAATIIDMQFDDTLGAAWLVDTTPLYEGVNSVRRGVIHLLPGIVAILDVCNLLREEETAIRWHTIDHAEPNSDGAFTVENDGVTLAAQMVSLNSAAPTFSRGEHQYVEPFHLDRLGYPLEQKHESFVEAIITSKQVRLLSLFAVFGPADSDARWQRTDDGWRIDTAAGNVKVKSLGTCVRAMCGDKSIALELIEGHVKMGSSPPHLPPLF